MEVREVDGITIIDHPVWSKGLIRDVVDLMSGGQKRFILTIGDTEVDVRCLVVLYGNVVMNSGTLKVVGNCPKFPQQIERFDTEAEAIQSF